MKDVVQASPLSAAIFQACPRHHTWACPYFGVGDLLGIGIESLQPVDYSSCLHISSTLASLMSQCLLRILRTDSIAHDREM